MTPLPGKSPTVHRGKVMLAAALAGALVGALASRGLSHGPGHGVRLAGAAPAFTRPMIASIALWVLFSIYWELAAARAAPVERAESAASRSIHVVLVSIGQLLVLLPVPGLRTRLFPASESIVVAGLAVQLACLGLAVWARRCLGRNWSGAIATTEGQRIVRSGPYRVVRHPIYSAVLGMYLGTMLVSGEAHAPLGVVIILVAYWRKVRLEEQHLHDEFGAEYVEYSDGTWRLVPGVY